MKKQKKKTSKKPLRGRSPIPKGHKRSSLRMGKYLKLTWRKLWIVVILGFVSILLHNLIAALYNIEEPIFFTIVVLLIPIYLIISTGYSLFKFIKNRK